MELEDALARTREHAPHVAKSVDKEVTTVGMFFLEDDIEVLVGEIQDSAAA